MKPPKEREQRKMQCYHSEKDIRDVNKTIGKRK
jgi:hypothetical protein